MAEVEVGAEVGREGGVRLRDRQVLQLRVEPLDGNIEIPVEGALDRIVHREVEHAVRLQWWAPCTQVCQIEGRGLRRPASGFQ